MCRIAIAICFSSCLLLGCGSSNAPTGEALAGSASVSNAMTAMENEDWKVAESEFTAAIEANVLSGDQYEEAVLGRIKARLQSELLDAAEEDLTMLEEGAAAMDQVLALKAELQLKRGDATAAKKTFQMARKFNPKVTAPKGL